MVVSFSVVTEYIKYAAQHLVKYMYIGKERRGYSHLKEEALDRTVWRTRFGRGFGPVVRQTKNEF